MKSFLTKSLFYSFLLIISFFLNCNDDNPTDPNKLLRNVLYFALIRPENDSNISKLFKYIDENGDEIESDANLNGYFVKEIKMKKGASIGLNAIGTSTENIPISILVSIDINGKNYSEVYSYEKPYYNQAAVSGRFP